MLHVLLQALYFDQRESLQSTEQGRALHERPILVLPTKSQDLPPCFGCVRATRVLSWTPPPQLLLQAENADHLENLQSIGHWKRLQELV